MQRKHDGFLVNERKAAETLGVHVTAIRQLEREGYIRMYTGESGGLRDVDLGKVEHWLGLLRAVSVA
jgi:predicted site-specific integrase-resolvase